MNDEETSAEPIAARRRQERTITQTDSYLAISVDDLPAAPACPERADSTAQVAELADLMRYQLHQVEAQVVSLGRELMSAAQGGTPPDAERALHLVTSSIAAARAALRAVDRLEVTPRRTRSPIPSR